MKYLVTGGAGFIGSHVCDALLADGHQVSVIDDLSSGHRHNLDERVELIIADCVDEDAVDRVTGDVDGVFHLAAIASVERSKTHWAETTRANLLATVNVFAAAAKRKIPVVYISSAAIYGAPSEMPIKESAIPSPQTAYGVDKYGCELHARVASNIHQVPTIGLRFFNVYGPRQDPASPYSGVISIFANRIGAGQSIVIHGDGQQTRDFIYVTDVVMHVTAAMAKLHEQPSTCLVLNVCTEKTTTVTQLAQVIAELSEVRLDASYGEGRAGDIRESQGSAKLAIESLGVQAKVDLRDGLKQTLGWMKQQAS